MAEKECSNSSCSKESCKGCPHSGNNSIPKEELNSYSRIGKVIGIVSGKGGVGKSTVTSLIARGLSKEGFSVGIMDGDITGPSIPKMFGINGMLSGSEMGIEPAVSKEGIKIVSMNLLLDSEEAPVVYRGPIIAGIIKQFWTDVHWGELDYLLIDMPPGTGDVPLTAYQSLPVDGIVIVTSPQELVKMIVMKAYNMAEMMSVPVIGMVENYSYFKCPDCGSEYKIFGESGIDELSAELGIPVLGRLPIMPEIAASADTGDGVSDMIKFDLDAFRTV